MAKKVEKTSKKVASKAGKALAEADLMIAQLKISQTYISDAIRFLQNYKSVAGSALTQREK